MWEYEDVSGVPFPVLFTQTFYEPGATDSVELKRQLRLKSVVLNEPIDPEYFGWNRLGLVEGDQAVDLIRGTKLRYHNGGMIAADQYPTSIKEGELQKSQPAAVVDPPSTPLSGSKIFVWTNVMFFLVLVVTFFFRRMRLKDTSSIGK